MSSSNDTAACVSATLSPACTVNAAIERSPSTVGVFKSLGIDTCCGGQATLGEAAVRARISTEALIQALERAEPSAPASAPLTQAGACSCGCQGH